MIQNLILAICIILLLQCSDDKTYKDAQNIALSQYLLSCTGGSIQSCKKSCDGKCGITSSQISSIQIDCVNSCAQDCNHSCNSILLFLVNTKD